LTTWHYEAGHWTETAFLDDAWEAASSSNWDTVRESLGYAHYTGIGDEHGNAFTLAVHRRDEPPKFIVEFSDGNIWDAVTAGTLPDALDLLARYAPIVTASEIACAVSDIRNLEQYGIVTDVLASAEVNHAATEERAASERRTRQEYHCAAAERRRQAGKEHP
jgi:hypothetical protein